MEHPSSALVRTAHLLDGDLDAPPFLRVVPIAIAIALNRSLCGFQFGPVCHACSTGCGQRRGLYPSPWQVLLLLSSLLCRSGALSRRETEAQGAAMLIAQTRAFDDLSLHCTPKFGCCSAEIGRRIECPLFHVAARQGKALGPALCKADHAECNTSIDRHQRRRLRPSGALRRPSHLGLRPVADRAFPHRGTAYDGGLRALAARHLCLPAWQLRCTSRSTCWRSFIFGPRRRTRARHRALSRPLFRRGDLCRLRAASCRHHGRRCETSTRPSERQAASSAFSSPTACSSRTES